MKHLDATLLLDTVHEAGIIAGFSMALEAKEPGSIRTHKLAKGYASSKEEYSRLRDHCNELGLTATCATAQRISEMAAKTNNPIIEKWRDIQEELRGRLMDELEARVLLFIEPDKVRYYNDTELFGPIVSERFPSCIPEIEEAGKCLALDRGTACVFHLMRVMEVGLRALGAYVGVRKKSPTWDAVLRAIDGKLNPKPGVKKSRRWRKQEQFVAEAASHLRAVKTAWRNPVMHRIDNVYGGSKTEDVFRHVQAFMVHLASELREARAV